MTTRIMTQINLKRLKRTFLSSEKVMTAKKHVISLQNDRGTEYQAYISVQNELAKAYNELRDDISRKKFGKLFADSR